MAAETGPTALLRGGGETEEPLDAARGSEVAQAELTGMTNIGRSADHVEGTPSFFINGRNAEVTAWPALNSKLDLAPKAAYQPRIRPFVEKEEHDRQRVV